MKSFCSLSYNFTLGLSVQIINNKSFDVNLFRFIENLARILYSREGA